jgi:hypothetical protein
MTTRPKSAPAVSSVTTPRDRVDYDVDAAELLDHGIRDPRATLSGADIRSHKQVLWRKIVGPRPCRGNDHRAGLVQPCRHGFADPLGAAGDERPVAIEFENAAHQLISRAMISGPASLNR